MRKRGTKLELDEALDTGATHALLYELVNQVEKNRKMVGLLKEKGVL